MGVEGCTKCIKYMLFFFNFIFWLAGCVILGVSLWLRHDNKTSSLLELKYDGAEAPSTFYISVYILIAVGAVMMFVGFLGCYGAIQESQCLLGTVFHETVSSPDVLRSTQLIKLTQTPLKPNNNPDNCHDKIRELFSEKIYLIGIAALVVAVIMIFEMIFSMVLCCGIRNSPVY
uniref:CD81 molecule a n=1 Tax=Cyprinus carpio TaxID=7962 RepID=A0A8C1QZY1_CYPCA